MLGGGIFYSYQALVFANADWEKVPIFQKEIECEKRIFGIGSGVKRIRYRPVLAIAYEFGEKVFHKRFRDFGPSVFDSCRAAKVWLGRNFSELEFMYLRNSNPNDLYLDVVLGERMWMTAILLFIGGLVFSILACKMDFGRA